VPPAENEISAYALDPEAATRLWDVSRVLLAS
jgi:hypothetical protein